MQFAVYEIAAAGEKLSPAISQTATQFEITLRPSCFIKPPKNCEVALFSAHDDSNLRNLNFGDLNFSGLSSPAALHPSWGNPSVGNSYIATDFLPAPRLSSANKPLTFR
jgi:hypothetical protein